MTTTVRSQGPGKQVPRRRLVDEGINDQHTVVANDESAVAAGTAGDCGVNSIPHLLHRERWRLRLWALGLGSLRWQLPVRYERRNGKTDPDNSLLEHGREL